MPHARTKDLIAAYYDAFNRGEPEAMEAMLHDDFEHHVNEGGIRRGKDGFAAFNRHMSETYRENLTDMVIFANEDGSRAAAEFVVNGTYLKTDPGLPAHIVVEKALGIADPQGKPNMLAVIGVIAGAAALELTILERGARGVLRKSWTRCYADCGRGSVAWAPVDTPRPTHTGTSLTAKSGSPSPLTALAGAIATP